MDDFKWTTIETISDNLVEMFLADRDFDTFRECRDNVIDMVKGIFDRIDDLQEQLDDERRYKEVTAYDKDSRISKI